MHWTGTCYAHYIVYMDKLDSTLSMSRLSYGIRSRFRHSLKCEIAKCAFAIFNWSGNDSRCRSWFTTKARTIDVELHWCAKNLKAGFSCLFFEDCDYTGAKILSRSKTRNVDKGFAVIDAVRHHGLIQTKSASTNFVNDEMGALIKTHIRNYCRGHLSLKTSACDVWDAGT